MCGGVKQKVFPASACIQMSRHPKRPGVGTGEKSVWRFLYYFGHGKAGNGNWNEKTSGRRMAISRSCCAEWAHTALFFKKLLTTWSICGIISKADQMVNNI